MSQAATAEIPQRKRVATYERVSSEDQRQRETIKSQTDALAVRLAHDPSVELVERYVDDGVSGTIPMADRPAGRALLTDAARGVFQELWVYRIDRLGRDWVDPQVVWQELARYGVTVFSVSEGKLERFVFTIFAGLAAKERETFLDRCALGLDRAAREGRYCGGVVSLGYRVEGKPPHARLVPDDTVIWGNLTAADLVRRIYHHLALDKWSCPKIADEFNALGIPTSSKRPGQGKRWKNTQGLWRGGHIRNLVASPIYRGELQYRRRIDKGKQPIRLREVITVQVPELALVSEELWYAAQATLSENRLCPKNTRNVYLLRSVMTCGCCGLTFVGTTAHSDTWYRCNGYLVDRGPTEGRCTSKAVKGETIEPQIWADIEAFLRNPGELLARLEREAEADTAEVAMREQRTTLRTALADNAHQRDRLLDLAQSGLLEKEELSERLSDLMSAKKSLSERLRALEPAKEAPNGPEVAQTLSRLQRRLDEGLTDEERAEIVRLLVGRIVIHTETGPGGKKRARAVVEYRFPAQGQLCVVSTNKVKREGLNYTCRIVRRVIDLPSGRRRKANRP
jgi:site-specific DNA recombinase